MLKFCFDRRIIPKINQIYANEKHIISLHWDLTYFPVDPCRRLFATCNDNQAISKKSCYVASFFVDGAACLEAFCCDCKRVGQLIREPCDFVCPGCPQWEQ